MQSSKFSRREMLKWMGMGSAATVLAACAPAATETVVEAEPMVEEVAEDAMEEKSEESAEKKKGVEVGRESDDD